MIILGRNENSEQKRKHLGSNTLHIINETDYPVVTIFGNNNPQNAQKTLLLPLDLTKNYTEQLTVAKEYALAFGAKIKAITVDSVDSVAHDAQMLVKMNKIKEHFTGLNIEIETEIVEALV